MTPRSAVWQNAQQLPLFLQGECPQRKPWLAFLVGFWLAWLLLAFWLVWFGSWLAFWLVWFGSWLVWFGSWLAFWLVWLGSWLVWFGSWLAFWLVWFGSWLAFWLVWFGSWLVWFGSWLAFWLVWLGSSFFPCFSSPCRNAAAGHFCSLTPARSVLDFESFAGRGQMQDGRVLGASQVEYKPFGKPPLKREGRGCALREGTKGAAEPACGRLQDRPFGNVVALSLEGDLDLNHLGNPL